MKVNNILICFFYITLQSGETVRTFTREEGESFKVMCEFGFSGKRKFLCKEVCEGKNILIETTEDRAQSGRYYLVGFNRGFLSPEIAYMSIKQLKLSDSGLYLCRSDTWAGTNNQDFRVVVTKAAQKTTTPQSLTSSETNKPSEKSDSGLQLYVALTLIAKIVLFSTPLVIFCLKRRVRYSKDPVVMTAHAVVS